jgi:hypothetical protein
MARDFGDFGAGAGDLVNLSAQVGDDTLGANDRTILDVTLDRIDGPATTARLWVVLVDIGGAAPTVIDPPGPVFGPVSVGFKGGITLPASVQREVHFIIDNPPGGAPTATYFIVILMEQPDLSGLFYITAFAPVADLSPV